MWNRIQPTIQEGRKRFSNKLFAAHIEKAANHFESWAENNSPWGLSPRLCQMDQQMRSQREGSCRLSLIYIHNPMLPGVPQEYPGIFRRRAHLLGSPL